jgi:molecular chaperone GrpE
MSENTTEEVESQEENTVVEPGQEADPVATLTSDLQRLQAEYANYKKRVERDRAVAHESAVGAVLSELLALLDDVDRAEQHGELSGGFKAVADQLNSITSRIGLEKYGTEGELFDPQIHEALMHDESADVVVPTASKILQPGYKYKERILRPARVAVTDPVGA